jgi:hypothetical protein
MDVRPKDLEPAVRKPGPPSTPSFSVLGWEVSPSLRGIAAHVCRASELSREPRVGLAVRLRLHNFPEGKPVLRLKHSFAQDGKSYNTAVLFSAPQGWPSQVLF